VQLDDPSSKFFPALQQSLMDIRDRKKIPKHLLEATKEELLNAKNTSGNNSRLVKAIDGFQEGIVRQISISDLNKTTSDIVKNIHEACCDLFMIQCANMTACQYLDFICDYMYTIMQPFEIGHRDIPSNYTLRIGMILDYFSCVGGLSADNSAKYDLTADTMVKKWQKHNEKLLEQRVILTKRPHAETLRIDPSLTIRDEDINRFISSFEQAVGEVDALFRIKVD
jgi:hypothetical protein